MFLRRAQLGMQRPEALAKRAAYRLLLLTAAALSLGTGLGHVSLLLPLPISKRELFELTPLRGLLEQRRDVGGQCVLVLLNEAVDIVRHVARIMMDTE